jgi:RHH-type proline utilization regulon transcriptional repressor/proline dehydrogenase/delta 1-pyrroline-5-carboxylate dehydrogenase
MSLIDLNLPLFSDEGATLKQIDTHKHCDETNLMQELMQSAQFDANTWKRIQTRSKALVQTVRQQRLKAGGLDAFMAEYDLSSNEGIALMCLAEALLRIPDKFTADKLIRDKICGADWQSHIGKSESTFVNATTWSLMLTGKFIDRDQQKHSYLSKTWRGFVNRNSDTVVRNAVRKAMQILGKQFVMGETIASALKRAASSEAKGYRYSYDMLGEAAKTREDAAYYYKCYIDAIHAIGKQTKGESPENRAGISIKLSALHPRYEVNHQAQVLDDMLPMVLELARLAKQYNINLTIDAEESERLLLSLVFLEKLAGHQELAGWHGLGLAVQAYQKRAPWVIDWLSALAQRTQRRFMVRLVKGAYWDSEIKHAQENGYDGYPVFTRKVHTDVCYLVCIRKLLDNPQAFYPQFATHNALSVAMVLEFAGERDDFEFQCLHGMGQTLYDSIVTEKTGKGHPCRVYAPVGSHKHLLAYLVRRLLENGANSSFVNRIVDHSLPIDELVKNPITLAQSHQSQPHPGIPLPQHIYGESRMNAKGIDLSNPQSLEQLNNTLQTYYDDDYIAMPLLAKPFTPKGKGKPVTNPANHTQTVGTCHVATEAQAQQAIDAAVSAFADWEATDPNQRADYLVRLADLLEENMPRLMAITIKEAGKTVENAVAEVREAIDFCRYYAQETRDHFATARSLPGPTGEQNQMILRGRGVFVCISPWNFPLAIFLGEVTAALAAGNTVVAKPAEQTSLIATAAVELMHQAGIPRDVIQLVPGSGSKIGNAMVKDPRIAGVIFTGSTEVAKTIQRNLAEKPGAIATLIAETGGQNCMLVDSSALPEQVVTDVLKSSFDSAGQRCSALRVLYLQEDIADTVMTMLKGAMNTLSIGDPSLLTTDVGPVIDAKAKTSLRSHIDTMKKAGKSIYQLKLPKQCDEGSFIPPTLIELDSISELEREQFGPILHVIRYQAKALDQVIADVNSTGYGLTFGIHSRIQDTVNYVIQRIHAGNLYVNRNMVGAIVGVQPFGGEGLSGTGPKAGGPYYLPRLATERVISIDTTASGGNASLMTLEQD